VRATAQPPETAEAAPHPRDRPATQDSAAASGSPAVIVRLSGPWRAGDLPEAIARRWSAEYNRKGIPYGRFKRYLPERPVSYNHPHTGEPVLTSQIRITVDGIAYLRKRLGVIREEGA
jgi:hypothetical protein